MDIILCCGKNGTCVVFGTVDSEPVKGEPVRLQQARMVLRWSSECGGLLGLAANGPKTTTSLTPEVPLVVETVWQEMVQCTETAAKQIRDWPSA